MEGDGFAMGQLTGAFFFFVVVVIALVLLRSIKIAQEYERAVIFSLGRVTRRPRGTGGSRFR